jgi:hypothetical protein
MEKHHAIFGHCDSFRNELRYEHFQDFLRIGILGLWILFALPCGRNVWFHQKQQKYLWWLEVVVAVAVAVAVVVVAVVAIVAVVDGLLVGGQLGFWPSYRFWNSGAQLEFVLVSRHARSDAAVAGAAHELKILLFSAAHEADRHEDAQGACANCYYY